MDQTKLFFIPLEDIDKVSLEELDKKKTAKLKMAVGTHAVEVNAKAVDSNIPKLTLAEQLEEPFQNGFTATCTYSFTDNNRALAMLERGAKNVNINNPTFPKNRRARREEERKKKRRQRAAPKR